MQKSVIALAMASAAGIACAGTTTAFTNEADFFAQLAAGAYSENFDSIPVGLQAPGLSFSGGDGFSYSAAGVPGADGAGGTGELFNDPGLLTLNSATDALQITFTGAPVTAVGGLFLATDINFFEVPFDVFVTLSDGTTESFNGSGFVGFTSSMAISSITIDSPDVAGPSWPAADILIVGSQIPTPGAVAVLGLGGLVAARRRR